MRLAAPGRGRALPWPPPPPAAQPQFWKIEGARDFLDGDTEGLSVDSEGRVRLAPAAAPLHDPEAPYVWCAGPRRQGRALRGHRQRRQGVPRSRAARAPLFFDAPSSRCTPWPSGPTAASTSGTSPDGKVYAVDARGQGRDLLRPGRQVHLGPRLRPRRATCWWPPAPRAHPPRRPRRARPRSSSPAPRPTSPRWPWTRAGNVYAGSAPGGILYRIDPAGKVFVLHDSPYREVKALDVGADGSLYAAVIDGKDEGRRRAARARACRATAAGRAGGARSRSPRASAIGPPRPPPRAAPPAAPAGAAARPARPRARVLRMLPSGEVDTLWSSADETPHALVAEPDGVLVGTGNKGKLYRVRDDRTWTMLASFPAEQVTALLRARGGRRVPGHLEPGQASTCWRRAPAPRAPSPRRCKDTETVSSWGRLRWEASVPAGHARSRSQTPQRQHGHPRHHLVRLVGGLHARRRASRSPASARASCR